MRFLAFSSRNVKELIREPFSIIFGIGLPLVILTIMSALQNSIAVEIFSIVNLSPGIAMFSFAFITLFTGLLIAKDRSSSYLARLFASPLSSIDYIIGYSLPLLPIAVLQSIVLFSASFFFGLSFSINILSTIIILILSAFLFIGLGLLLGSILNDKQVGGIASIIIQLVAFTSGMWFDLKIIGGVYEIISYSLPFAHIVDVTRASLQGDFSNTFIHLIWIIGYTIIIYIFAIYLFKKKMKN